MTFLTEGREIASFLAMTGVMEKLSKAQLGCIKTLVTKLKVQDSDALVLGFSNMRTQHVSELHVTEAIAMIKHLKKSDPDEEKAQRMRGKMIGMAYERAAIGRNAEKKRKQAVVDWLDGWCKQYGYKHKKLNSHTLKELPKLVSQFELVLNDLLINV